MSRNDYALAPPPSPPAPKEPSPLFTTPPGTFNRLSQPFILRLLAVTSVTGVAGFVIGLRNGAQTGGLRFRAENAHRLPNTQAGWYLYHKSKNYHIALGGIYEGFRVMRRMAPWAGLFVVCEEGVDRGRAAVVRGWRSHRDVIVGVGVEEEERLVAGNKDFVSSMLAGLVSAGAFAGWKRMPVPTTVRLMKMGAKAGAGFGLAQDGLNLLKGGRLGYVEWIRRNVFGMKKVEGAVGVPG